MTEEQALEMGKFAEGAKVFARCIKEYGLEATLLAMRIAAGRNDE